MKKKHILRIKIRNLLTFIFIIIWFLTGWPPLFNFPPKIEEARAAVTTIFLTTGTTWTVPGDWNSASNTIEVVGGSGGGGGGATGAGSASGSGGGGGAYAKISNLTLTQGGSVTIQVGNGGGGGAAGANGTAGTATFFNGTTCTGASACGAGGSNGLTGSATGGAGGTTANSVGTTKFAGGNGGGGSTANGTSGGGGGGAAGLNGAGNNAAAGPSAGGSGDAGFGGAGGAAGNPAGAGSAGTEYDATHGSGGGGGGGNAKAVTATGGAGGAYGSGGGGGGGKAAGGNGAQGLIIITYTPLLPTFNQSAYRLFNNLNSTDVGTALAAQDTAATLGATGAAFRLRALIHVATSTLAISGQAFKLQFAQQSGTCDTGFVGEAYADVTALTVIAYNDNATPLDGATLTANVNDPTHGADTIVNQTYEELNNFTNSVAAIPAAQDGKWDFSLKDNGATASTAYCLRAVKSDGTVLDTYTVIPQITTAAAAAKLYFTVIPGNFLEGIYYKIASFWKVYSPWPQRLLILLFIGIAYLWIRKHFNIQIGLKKPRAANPEYPAESSFKPLDQLSRRERFLQRQNERNTPVSENKLEKDKNE